MFADGPEPAGVPDMATDLIEESAGVSRSESQNTFGEEAALTSGIPDANDAGSAPGIIAMAPKIAPTVTASQSARELAAPHRTASFITRGSLNRRRGEPLRILV